LEVFLSYQKPIHSFIFASFNGLVFRAEQRGKKIRNNNNMDDLVLEKKKVVLDVVMYPQQSKLPHLDHFRFNFKKEKKFSSLVAFLHQLSSSETMLWFL
jgi:hypothetical protein